MIDFPALFRTLIEIGYQGQVGLEYEINAKDPLPGMIESMAYMRRRAGGGGDLMIDGVGAQGVVGFLAIS